METLDFKPSKGTGSSADRDIKFRVGGNTVYFKDAILHGKPAKLTIVVRSDEDVKRAKHPKYQPLVP